MTTLEGQAVNLSNLKGKVVFVNIWASCWPPCRAEMPGIEALYKQADHSKVPLVMRSLDNDAAKAQEFVRAKGYSFSVHLRTGDRPALFDSKSIPCTVILGPDRQVAARNDGMEAYGTPKFKVTLKQLAASSGR